MGWPPVQLTFQPAFRPLYSIGSWGDFMRDGRARREEEGCGEEISLELSQICSEIEKIRHHYLLNLDHLFDTESGKRQFRKRIFFIASALKKQAHWEALSASLTLNSSWLDRSLSSFHAGLMFISKSISHLPILLPQPTPLPWALVPDTHIHTPCLFNGDERKELLSPLFDELVAIWREERAIRENWWSSGVLKSALLAIDRTAVEFCRIDRGDFDLRELLFGDSPYDSKTPWMAISLSSCNEKNRNRLIAIHHRMLTSVRNAIRKSIYEGNGGRFFVVIREAMVAVDRTVSMLNMQTLHSVDQVVDCLSQLQERKKAFKWSYLIPPPPHLNFLERIYPLSRLPSSSPPSGLVFVWTQVRNNGIASHLEWLINRARFSGYRDLYLQVNEPNIHLIAQLDLSKGWKKSEIRYNRYPTYFYDLTLLDE